MNFAHQLPAILCTALLIMYGIAALAQDSVHNRKNSRRMTDLFADSAQLSSSDYQLSIENAYGQLSQQIVNWTLTNNQRQIHLEQRIIGSNDMEVVATIIKKAVAASKYAHLRREPQVLFVGVHPDGFDVRVFSGRWVSIRQMKHPATLWESYIRTCEYKT